MKLETNKSKISRSLAEIALEIGAIKVSPKNPFTWASGYRMPLYNDNRLLFSLPKNRELITKGFKELADALSYSPNIICGCATGGIAPAVCLADALNLPFSYVRSSSKSHGLAKQVEGADPKGKHVLVIEDLVSTGGSSIAVVDSLRDAGATVTDVLSIFNYGFEKAVDTFSEKNAQTESLLSLSVLLETAVEQQKIESSELETLKSWQENPFSWGENNGFAK